MLELIYRRGEKVHYLGSNKSVYGYVPPQDVVITAVFEGFHLPYEIETVWADGSKHVHCVEQRRLERVKS